MVACPVYAEDNQDELPILPNIFIWETPDDNTSEEELTDNIPDENTDEEIALKINKKPEKIPFRGYAEFDETADTIYLQNENNNLVLNIRVPQKFDTPKLTDSKKFNKDYIFSKYNSEEYSISPESIMAVEKKGDFSYGTLFNTGIDTSQLERSATLFTRYEKNRFAVSSAFKKNNLTAYGLNTDTFYFAPEFRLNEMFSFSEVLSADMTRDRRKGEFVLTVYPRKDDRMLLEIGAGQTYDINRSLINSQLRFSTKFKL